MNALFIIIGFSIIAYSDYAIAIGCALIWIGNMAFIDFCIDRKK